MTTASDSYDAIVIGAGHNGLVAAAYLARAGLSALVLERRHIVGGCCVTEELWPGFRSSRAAYVASLIRPAILKDLQLESHGLKLLPRQPSSFTPLPDGRHLLLGADAAENHREVAKFSRRDAEALPRYEAMLERAARLIEPFLDRPPIDPHALRLSDWAAMASVGWKAFRSRSLLDLAELLGAPARPILERWFECEPLRATLATDSIIGALVSPSTPGSAYVLLHHVMGEAGGARGVWAYVQGGMGAFAEALHSAARSLGVRVETGAEAARILIKDGRADGVALANGREIRSRLVLSCADPRVTFLRLLGPGDLPDDFRRRVEAIDFSAASAKINLALDRLPRFKARPEGPGDRELRGTIHFSPTLDFIEDAYLDAVRGEPSKQPIVEMTIPSTVDGTLAPPGKHVASMFVQYAPTRLAAGASWDDPGVKERFAERSFAVVEEYAPGFRSSILHHEVLSPLDLERIFGLTGGNIFHGAMSPHQLFFLRPVPGWARYRTPVPGLYLCGAGAHPGGGIMGACGRNAALEALRSWRRT